MWLKTGCEQPPAVVEVFRRGEHALAMGAPSGGQARPPRRARRRSRQTARGRARWSAATRWRATPSRRSIGRRTPCSACGLPRTPRRVRPVLRRTARGGRAAHTQLRASPCGGCGWATSSSTSSSGPAERPARITSRSPCPPWSSRGAARRPRARRARRHDVRPPPLRAPRGLDAAVRPRPRGQPARGRRAQREPTAGRGPRGDAQLRRRPSPVPREPPRDPVRRLRG